MRFMVASETELEEVNFELHDRWIDADAIQQLGQEVHIPITQAPMTMPRARHFICKLIVSPVVSFTIEDTQKIGYYDVHSVVINSTDKRLEIRFNIPLGLKFRLGALPAVLDVV